MTQVYYQLTKLEGFLIADRRHKNSVVDECSDRWQSVSESADGAELQVIWQWRLIDASYSTLVLLLLAMRCVLDLVDHVLSEKLHTRLRVSSADESLSTGGCLNITCTRTTTDQSASAQIS